MTEFVKEPQPADSADGRYPGLAGVKAIVAFASVKGGSGKTAMLANIAAALALKGRKIGVADTDLDAPSAAAMLGVSRVRLIWAKSGVEPVNGPFGIRIIANDPASSGSPPISFTAEQSQWEPNGWFQPDAERFGSPEELLTRSRFGALDLLLVDLAPGFANAARLAEMVGRAGMVMVTTSSAIATAALQRALKEARSKQIRIVGLLENMEGFYCGGCHSVRPLLPRGDISALSRDFDVPILGRIPFDSRLAESCDDGRVFVREYPDAPVSKLIGAAAGNLWDAVAALDGAAQTAPDRP